MCFKSWFCYRSFPIADVALFMVCNARHKSPISVILKQIGLNSSWHSNKQRWHFSSNLDLIIHPHSCSNVLDTWLTDKTLKSALLRFYLMTLRSEMRPWMQRATIATQFNSRLLAFRFLRGEGEKKRWSSNYLGIFWKQEKPLEFPATSHSFCLSCPNIFNCYTPKGNFYQMWSQYGFLLN